MGYVGIDLNKFLNNDIWGSISSIYWENVPNFGVGGRGGRQNIINFCVDDIRGSISSIYWENVPNLGVGGGEGGNSISFFLSWGCVRDSGGVDLQTKL